MWKPEINQSLLTTSPAISATSALVSARGCVAETSRRSIRRPGRVKFSQRLQPGNAAAADPAAGHRRAPLKIAHRRSSVAVAGDGHAPVPGSSPQKTGKLIFTFRVCPGFALQLFGSLHFVRPVETSAAQIRVWESPAAIGGDRFPAAFADRVAHGFSVIGAGPASPPRPQMRSGVVHNFRQKSLAGGQTTN